MKITLSLFIILLCISCKPQPELHTPVSGDDIKKHMEEISSDKYMGRMPCSEGEKLTIEYIKQELESYGLDTYKEGEYFQEVPLLTIDGKMSQEMSIDFGTKEMKLQKGKDFVIHTQRKVDNISLDASELVFCGYGIVDEKSGWNDYAGLDMKGKTAVVLVNDPGYGGDDQDFFRGDIMTYFGRWTYKYEEADRQGADGLIIIHETSSAGYPWFVVQSSWTGPQQGLSGIDRSQDCGIKGWISLMKAKELFETAGLDFTAEIKKARKPGFKPVPLNSKVSVNLENSYEECLSQNVLAYVKGSTYPDEYIVYTTHWDHIGVGKVVEGDSIYNGALDNASGTSALLSIAKSFSQSPRPERSIVFLFVTAEEQGLLGSEYYTRNPIFPLENTVCNLNLDGVNPAGKMNDFTITGIGHSEMDEIADEAAKEQGRYTMAEQQPEKGSFFRSDQFNFAKSGVPVLYAEGGYDHAEKGKEYAREFKDNYVAKNYHAPSDEYVEGEWDIDGMVQDAQIYYNIGNKLANNRQWPKWYPDSEFKRPGKKLQD
ncbi:MAG: M28 family peptidase [Saprospiraceae bacterium]|nr:M28 family peptidase [Bacteroidia bacterium]NNF20553.1 M28 family peptidase [Saprospiraceae bacterium]